ASLFFRRFKTTNRDFRPPCSFRLIRPKEVLQAKIGKTRFCFFASAPSGSSEFLIDGSRRFPLRIFLQQARSVKPSLVIPEEFAPPIGTRVFLQYFVKSGKRIGALAFLFQTQSLLKQCLVAPVNRLVLVGGELIIDFDRKLVIVWIGCAHLKENVAFATQRLAFF